MRKPKQRTMSAKQLLTKARGQEKVLLHEKMCQRKYK